MPRQESANLSTVCLLGKCAEGWGIGSIPMIFFFFFFPQLFYGDEMPIAVFKVQLTVYGNVGILFSIKTNKKSKNTKDLFSFDAHNVSSSSLMAFTALFLFFRQA